MPIPHELTEPGTLELTGYLIPPFPSPIFIAYHGLLPSLVLGEEVPLAITPEEGEEGFAHGIYCVVAMDSYGYELEYRRAWILESDDDRENDDLLCRNCQQYGIHFSPMTHPTAGAGYRAVCSYCHYHGPLYSTELEAQEKYARDIPSET